METSLFISQVIGPIYLILAVAIMLNRKSYRKLMDEWVKNPTSILFGGMVALVVGFLIVASHNRWVNNWTVVITIFGWLGVAKGVWLTVFPDTVPKFMKAYKKNKSMIMVHAVAALLVGVFFTIFGYIV